MWSISQTVGEFKGCVSTWAVYGLLLLLTIFPPGYAHFPEQIGDCHQIWFSFLLRKRKQDLVVSQRLGSYFKMLNEFVLHHALIKAEINVPEANMPK